MTTVLVDMSDGTVDRFIDPADFIVPESIYHMRESH